MVPSCFVVCSVYYRLVLKLSHLKLLYPTELGLLQGSPAELVTDYEKNEDFLCKIHRVLLEVKVLEGCLQCPDSGQEATGPEEATGDTSTPERFAHRPRGRGSRWMSQTL
ncbi:multifunctional methyltransferase subunit TRM112-like protein isoform X3 [Oncorhynchus nerka]|uniref:multifunctional methyltransferase subunit TRM112-like protein isoform X3 n=1 Tax=Oncorhynchus nerka TaxID=8023 RepID=UPI0031B854CC